MQRGRIAICLRRIKYVLSNPEANVLPNIVMHILVSIYQTSKIKKPYNIAMHTLYPMLPKRFDEFDSLKIILLRVYTYMQCRAILYNL